MAWRAPPRIYLPQPRPRSSSPSSRIGGARTKTEERLSLDALAERIRAMTAPAKEDLPWLKFARFGRLPTKNGSLR